MYGFGALGSYPYGMRPIAPTIPTAEAWRKAWLMTGLVSDQATLDAGLDAAMPAANLQDKQPAKKYRSANGIARILITLPYAMPFNALFWGAHNHTPGGWRRLIASNTLATLEDDPELDTNWGSVWPLGAKPQDPDWLYHGSLLTFENEVSYKYALYEANDNGVAMEHLEAGRLMLGRALPFTLNVDFGAKRRITSNDSLRRSAWGGNFGSRRSSSRGLVLPFETATEADAVAVEELARRLGTTGDLVASLDPAAGPRFHRNLVHGTLVDTASDFEGKPLWNESGMLWSFALTVDQLI